MRGKQWRAALLGAAVLYTVGVGANAAGAAEALRAMERSAALPLALLRFERGVREEETASPLLALILRGAPRFAISAPADTAEAWSSELVQPPADDSEDSEGSVLTAQPPTETESLTALRSVTDNGVAAQTLRPRDPAGYVVSGGVYVNNASSCALTPEELTGAPAAVLGAEGPQVLIVHTHGTEAYTMPPGEEYAASDDHRTLDERYNMLRVGDEMAAVLEECGIETVHDRGLYDYPNYSGAYNRSLAAIERQLAEHPTIRFVLDVHRDAVENADGSLCKLLCAEEPDAAQLEFVLGTDGGGARHDGWRDNLRLACAVQRTLLGGYPTLLRPITLRNARYNQHMTAGSLLVEVGTAGNSLEEALNAARLFATGFAETLKAS